MENVCIAHQPERFKERERHYWTLGAWGELACHTTAPSSQGWAISVLVLICVLHMHRKTLSVGLLYGPAC